MHVCGENDLLMKVDLSYSLCLVRERQAFENWQLCSRYLCLFALNFDLLNK